MFSGVMEAIHNFEFAAPMWLAGLVLLPILWALYALVYSPGANETQAQDFADPHLLPHLLVKGEIDMERKNKLLPALAIWSLLWACGVIAMAGPRWDYTEIAAFTPSRNLVVLLDLSRSMDAEDTKPSRLARARQEVEDLLRLGEGVNIGLIAFDSVPHVITPLTDDRQTLRRLLPSLTTGLVHVQGSDLSKALRAAQDMLETESGTSRNILVISDGGFTDSDSSILDAQLALRAQGIRVYMMGAGTTQGAPIPDARSGQLKTQTGVVISRLDRNRMQRIARDGNGVYFDMNYLENDTNALLGRINTLAAGAESEQTTRFWEERFYIFLLPFAFLLLPWFRRHAVFPALLFMLIVHGGAAQAAEWKQMFMNKEQQAAAAFKSENYDQAEDMFDDPYRQGVAEYKAGKFSRAIHNFSRVERPEVMTDAQYNLGNAYLMNNQIKEAIAAYEGVLKDHPDHDDARHNLEIAKKLLKDQQKQGQPDGDEQQSEDENNSKDQSGNQDQQQSGGEDKDQAGQSDGRDDQQDKTPQDDEKGDKGGQGEKQDDKGQKGDQQEEQEQQDDDSNKPDQQTEEGSERPSDDQQQPEPQPGDEKAPQGGQRTQKDIDADQWLNRIENSPTDFLRQKFYIESLRQGAKQGSQPW